MNLGTLKDANTIARSPFLQEEEIRFRTSPPTLMETWNAWSICKKRTTHANMSTFNDLRPQDCMDVLVSHLRASLFKHPESMKMILKDRQCEYDPSVLPWKPKPKYLEQLASEKRLPEEMQSKVEDQMRQQQKQKK